MPKYRIVLSTSRSVTRTGASYRSMKSGNTCWADAASGLPGAICHRIIDDPILAECTPSGVERNTILRRLRNKWKDDEVTRFEAFHLGTDFHDFSDPFMT